MFCLPRRSVEISTSGNNTTVPAYYTEVGPLGEYSLTARFSIKRASVLLKFEEPEFDASKGKKELKASYAPTMNRAWRLQKV